MPPEHVLREKVNIWLQLDHHRLGIIEVICSDFGGGTNNNIWVMVMVDVTKGQDGAAPDHRLASRAIHDLRMAFIYNYSQYFVHERYRKVLKVR